MHLLRLGPLGHEIPAVAEAGATYDLRSLTADVDGAFLAADGVARVRDALAAGTLPVLQDPERLRRGAPVARPAAVICIGQNYAAHAAESGAEPPSTPIVFLKHPNTVVGPDDTLPVPPGAERLDWEVELGVVIGRAASYLASPEEALAHVAGYTAVDDVSERAWQLDESLGQWSKGKCGPGFAPTGPALVPADELDAGDLRLRSWVNGEPRQDSTTADMIFDVAYLVWHLSQYMTLEPGDLICTGTPQGVALSGRFPYLRDGDVVEVEIAGVGRQRHVVADAVVPAAPAVGTLDRAPVAR
ncbi:2-keto-4-pentenoate hydratase/2-oxohepta-3-ene-1,7-dioic acid hydratase in catechol pathway [Cellulosimicrobium cellulans]|uniref:fumarylacetoacetate hydrolase family protein n=1 Tax=Cellulosimicrobium cellulans TaxID=1710 RepID=UPI00195F20D6|nr:fumarylacetoacetate hydrolase family protein [Cellulosimicrobium cellulans]MBM7818102.1 2-keto-4-pentenoate hydratase/2-oxohepta-3-ene-1,7-dioic acid hydratase in catechol pathway [Cellulosimicrobium cellulans]